MRRYIIVLVAILVTSCSFLDSKEQEASFYVPPLSEELKTLEISGYKVKITTEGFHDEFTCCDPQFKATVPVSGVTSVIACPCGSWGTLKPAGMIVCKNLKAKNYLSWEWGFIAECTSQALSSGYALTDIDFEEFEKKLVSSSDGDPWVLDQQKIVYALRAGSISSAYIKKSDSHTLSLKIGSESGTWYKNSPCSTKNYAQSEGLIEALEILDGENTFINPAAGKSISVYSDTLTWVCIYNSDKGLGGYW